MSFSLTSPAALRFFSLLGLMVLTRTHHFGSALHLPDASWAVFFLGGFYLHGQAQQRRSGHASFWLFAIAAAAIDFSSYFAGHTSGFCFTPTYGFLLPAYAALWQGGRLLARSRLTGLSFGAMAVICWAGAASLTFLITNGSFYWLSGRYAEPNISQYLERAAQYYGHFVTAPVVYLIAALALHIVLTHALARRTSLS